MQPGTQLNQYQVNEPIGKGGMGEVYRARDTRLGRDVAIKVLPNEFVRDRERVARLEREARMLAALNHPNIAAIHGLEESDDTRFLVLELVEGDTLADRLRRGAIPLEESLKLALQIAEALEAAHEKGVIHRDLKPANIKITPEGRVKVLDFGLAKALIGDQADVNLSNSPTLSMQATRAGVILGTAAYMSPEQARGDVADKRADIWAFGAVLFELLTGRGAFDGKTVSDVLASVLKTDPDWSALPALHPRLRFLLERCLEKEPRNRCQSIGEARAEIQKVLADPEGLALRPATAASAGAQRALPWVAAAALAIAAAGAAWLLKPEPGPEPGLVARFAQELAEGQNFRSLGRDVVAVSSDGAEVVYNTTGGLWLRATDPMEPRLIAGTEGAMTSPFFSPDGEWIGYWDPSRGELRKIRPTGGASLLLAAAANPQGASWADDNTIVFGQADGIRRVSGDGGEAELVVPAVSPEQLWDPQVLPNGSILYTAYAGPGAGMITVAEPGSADRTELFPGERAIYVPTGHLVVTDPQASPNTLLARTFDPDTLAFGGSVPVEERVAVIQGKTHYAVARNGSLAYIFGLTGAAGARPQRTLVWVDRAGQEEPLGVRADDYTMARISPDGSKVALVVGSSLPISDPPPDIWILDLTTGQIRQLTFNPEVDDMPVWSPDSELIYFRSYRNGEPGIYSIPADGGTGETTLAGVSPDFMFPSPWSISPDGQTIAFNYGATLDDINLATLSLGGDGVFTALLSETGYEVEPVIAPNGRWMAYMLAASLTTGPETAEINIRPFPAVSPQRIPVVRGAGPVFSADASELFYFDGQGISVVNVGYEPGFFARGAQPLFRGGYWYGAADPSGFGGRAWDLHPDSDRFLMINLPGVTDEAGAEPAAPRIHIVLNWHRELLERVPVD